MNPSWAWGAGNVVSSNRDLTTFLGALADWLLQAGEPVLFIEVEAALGVLLREGR